MSWRKSLVRLADYEVEQVRIRLAEIVERRSQAQMKLAVLQAELEAERALAARDAEAGWYRVGYLEGWRGRRDRVQAEIAELEVEEAGARDALARAFEELKKYEQLDENAQAAQRAAAARLEAAAMDELGARRNGSR
jgi:flagellar FliJ protein